MTRWAEMHCCPDASKAEPAIRVAASSRSASAQTMLAAFEPSSATNFLAPAARSQRVAGGGAAGKRDRRHVGVRGQRPGGLPVARNDVEQPVRQPGALEGARDDQRGLHPLRRRLDDRRVPHRERRRDLLHQEVGRCVERRDRAHHAIGDAPGESETARPLGGDVERQGLAPERADLGRDETHEGRRPSGLECGGANRLADIADQRGDDRVLLRLDLVGRLGQPCGARRRRGAAMRPESGERVLHRRVDQNGIRIDDPGCDAAVHRRDQLVTRLPVAAVFPAVDPGVKKGHIRHRRLPLSLRSDYRPPRGRRNGPCRRPCPPDMLRAKERREEGGRWQPGPMPRPRRRRSSMP